MSFSLKKFKQRFTPDSKEPKKEKTNYSKNKKVILDEFEEKLGGNCLPASVPAQKAQKTADAEKQ